MLDYTTVKILHVLFAMMLVGFATASLLDKSTRASMIGFGLGSLGSIVFGLALLGIGSLGMPPWVHVKITVWVVMMAGVGIINKRFPKFKIWGVVGLYALAAVNIYMALVKPF